MFERGGLFRITEILVFFTSLTRYTVNLTIPSGHGVMVSFPQETLYACITLWAVHTKKDKHDDDDDDNSQQKDEGAKEEFCCQYPSTPLIYNNNNIDHLTVQFVTAPDTACVRWQWESRIYRTTGFQMKYSFLTPSTTSELLPSGLWNCSGPHWSDFKHHFPCNLQKNYEEGEDEVYCPYDR
jgi:hypothetical protein